MVMVVWTMRGSECLTELHLEDHSIDSQEKPRDSGTELIILQTISQCKSSLLTQNTLPLGILNI